MKQATMRAPDRRPNKPRTYSREQRAIQKEFCDAYGFHPEQVAFDSNSLDPIFDYDALCVLSVKLCDLPDVEVTLRTVNHGTGIATSAGTAVLNNGNRRSVFGAAMVNEVMPDGEKIPDLSQAISISRARALRSILRAVGFDPVAAHRSFQRTGNVVELQLPTKLPRDKERAEIHMLATGLGLVKRVPGGIDRSAYEQSIALFFNGKTSSKDLSDLEHTQFLTMLRAFTKARAIAKDAAATAARNNAA